MKKINSFVKTNNVLDIILNEANKIKQKHDNNSLCKYQGEYFIRFEWLKDMIELQKNQLKLLKDGNI